MNRIEVNKMKSKVALIKCDNYDLENVYLALKNGIDLIGGIESFIPNKADRILMKPNLLNKAKPEQAVTTHPSVFDGTIRLFKEAGYENLFYGDSPGNPMNPEKIAEACGIKQIGDKYGLKFGDFNNGKTVNYPEGKFVKQFEISNAAIEADSIVNVCKMKTHQLERITGGVKNTLGCVYGLNKGTSHARFPDSDSFGKMLVDLSGLLKPKLHIMDGIEAMEGNGPFSGTPVLMKMLLISNDPVALDSVFARLINLDPLLVPTIKYGAEFGLGKYKDEDIEILGENIDLYKLQDFDVSRDEAKDKKWKNMSFVRKLVLKKPVIMEEHCVRCGVCVDACPVDKALMFINDKHLDPPKYDYDKCIRCYCCQEMCPEKAIIVKTPILGKMFIYKK
jgi:uncharacterized protein (DUF362 family)/NAD-dependent dihydropyrimidine dehydrogenase PreA subunit